MDIKKLIDICNKKKSPDLVLKNGNIINVFSNEIITGDIAIYDDIIVGIGEYNCDNIIDVSNKYISPGFIDPHIHIESSMLSPLRFANLVACYGTTTIIADPHEIVNVLGSNGMSYMLEQTENANCDVLFTLPSCVPATPFENNGFTFSHKDMEKFISHPRIIGLGEVMDYVSVLDGEKNIFDKINLFYKKPIDGHSPNLTGEKLQAYKLAGITTDHECVSFDEAIEKLRLGFKILIREGSAAHNLENILSGFINNNIPLDNCCFCTDDKHIEDIENNGHISNHIKKAISMGLNPIEAIKMATINPARFYNLSNIGAVCVGYKANLVILDDLKSININDIIYNGCSISKYSKKINISNNLSKNSINAKDLDENDIIININKNPTSIIELIPNQILTKHSKFNIKSKDNIFRPYDDFLKVIVVERHHKKDSIGLSIIKGFGLKNGAIGTTVSHDSHNIIIIGDNDKDILNVFYNIKKIGGGYVISSENKILDYLPLEIAGLMTDIPYKELSKKLYNLTLTAQKIGVNKCFDPFITMSFLALPVIPEIRLTDKGLFDVCKFKFI